MVCLFRRKHVGLLRFYFKQLFISHMDTIKQSRKSASKWEQCSERALLEIWSDRMDALRGCRKNSHILQEMAVALKAQGYTYTVMEIKTKMHNMTARYRKEKQKIGSTGGSPSEWDLYKDMEILLAPYKSYHAENFVTDSINDINSSIVIDSSQSPSPLSSPSQKSLQSPSNITTSPLSSPPVLEDSPAQPSSPAAIRKKKGIELFYKCLENIEKMQENIKTTTEKMLAIEEEKKNILKNYVDREAEVQNALTEFLKRPF